MLNSQDPNINFFIGREKELLKLKEILSSVIEDQKPKVVFIQADYGVGKTALVEQFLKKIKENNNEKFVIGRGKYTMEKDTGGYGAFGEAFGDLLTQGKWLKVNQDKLTDFIVNVAPAWIDLIPVAGVAVNAAIKTASEIRKLSKTKQTYASEGVYNQFANALSDLSKKHPAIIFLDDMQWADEGSFRLLFHLSSSTLLKNSAILFIVAYRPVEALETGEHAELFRDIHANIRDRLGAVDIKLDEDPDDFGINVRDYIIKRYPENTFPEELNILVQEQTKGHALFISQLFSWWEEEGLIISDGPSTNKVWSFSGKVDLNAPLPIKVGEIIDARIRHLSEQMQEILKCASVEGEFFFSQTIREILSLNEIVLAKELGALEKKYRFVEYEDVRGTGSVILDHYQFLHRYFRERIYFEQLGKGERRILHRSVGETLEELYKTNSSPIASQLMRHFSAAGMRHKGAGYALQASLHEQSRSSWSEATLWGHEGLKLLDEADSDGGNQRLRLDLLKSIADSFYEEGSYQNAEQYYCEAFAQAQKIEVPPELMLTLFDRCSYTSTDFDQGLKIAKEGLAYLQRTEVPKGVAYLGFIEAVGIAYWAIDDEENAMHYFSTVLKDAETMVQTPEVMKIVAHVYRRLGDIHGFHDQYQSSIENYHRSINIAKQIDYQWNLGQCLVNISEFLCFMGLYKEAEENILQGIQIAKQVGDQSMEVDGIYGLGFLRLQKGEYLSAIDPLQQAIKLAKHIGYVWNLGYFYTDLAEVYYYLGNNNQANRTIAKGIRTANHDGAKVYALLVLGKIKTAEKAWDRAEEAFQQSLKYYESVSISPRNQAEIKYEYAKMLVAKGELDKVPNLLNSSKDLFSQLKLNHEVSKVTTLLDNLRG